jgi:predicted esterase
MPVNPPPPIPATEHRSFRVPIECRYLLEAPQSAGPDSILAVALHGYGMNAAVMLSLARRLLGPEPILASIEAPNQFYLSMHSPDSSEIGYNWGTRAHWRSAVTVHHDMVRSVLAECRARFDVPRRRCLLAGFSQPVGLNYRFAATWPAEAAGVIGICGGVPRDWEEASYSPVDAALLHIARDQDEYYPPETAARFAGRLRLRAADVEFHMLAGAHRFPSQASRIVQPWLERVFPR